MKLYFSPLACSMATRIALYEAGAEATYVHVDSKTKKTEDGKDFLSINSLGLVPVLEIEPVEFLTENAAILQFVAARYPEARLAPDDLPGRTRLEQFLSFVSTELHKGLFGTLLTKTAHPEVHAYARSKGDARLSWLDQRLAGRQFVLDRFSVADGYLYTVTRWTGPLKLDVAGLSNVNAFMGRMAARPAVQQALKAEGLPG